ncbi:MAG TPA: SpoIIE family protein phosphatase [Leptospiraceae bacterium]|nr:SpoIIE family protein phosphatase [Leptospiraceae bacterium]
MTTCTRLAAIPGALVALFLTTQCGAPVEKLGASKGSARISIRDGSIVTLDGEWEAAWNQIIPPDSAHHGSSFFKLPGYWNDVEPLAAGQPSGHRYATFILRTKGDLPPDTAVYIKEARTAYALYCAKNLIASTGRVGSTWEPDMADLTPRLGKLPTDCLRDPEFTLQVSNFDYSLGGPGSPIRIGNHDLLRIAQIRRDALSFALAGILFVMTLYHIVWWLVRIQDLRNIWFSALSFLCMLRIIGTENAIPRLLGPGTFEMQMKVEFLAFYLMIPVSSFFFQSLFPREIHRIFPRIQAVMAVPFIAATIFLPTRIYSEKNWIYLLAAAIMIVYMIYGIALAAIRKRDGAITVLGGASIAGAAGMNDILVAAGVIPGDFLAPVGFFVLIFSQATVLARVSAKAFATAEHLSQNLREEVRQQTDELRQASEKLLQADKEKTAFFQNISHELRTPLTLIYGPVVDAVRRKEGIATEELGTVLSNARRLLRLVNQLLDLQKIAAGKMELRLRSMNLGEMLGSISEAFQPYANGKRIQIETQIDGDIPRVAADPDMIEKCVYNYLSNAVKFTPAGGRVRICAHRKDNGVEVAVHDSGAGISDENQAGLFTRFGRSEPSLTRDQEGTGLGLSLVRELIALHGGHVSAKSVPGNGASFYFWLPEISEILPEHDSSVSVMADIELADEVAADDASAHVQASGTTILLVEDNRGMRGYISGILRRSGYTVVETTDGQHGWTAVRSRRPSLIITDLMMPRMSGIDLIANVRADPELKTLPVILLTAKADTRTRQEAHTAGADNYLAKPFNELELLSVVSNLLTLKSTEARLVREIELARKIQNTLLPAKIPELPGLRIACRYKPMERIGGDLYDFCVYPDGSLGILIADVSGHGIAAAMIASMTKLAFALYGPTAESPADLLQQINSALLGRTGGNFITAQYAMIPANRKTVTVASAGHPAPLFIRDGETRPMLTRGPMLGILPSIQLMQFTLEIKSGDRLLLYTDGITEVMNAQKQLFEEKRLVDTLTKTANLPLEASMLTLIEEASAFAGTYVFPDDLTLVCFEFDAGI